MQPDTHTDAQLTAEVIAGLLPEFRRCDNYADRLSFWSKHQLTKQLYYDAVIVEREKHPADFLNACIKCHTWQDAKHLPILTLAPFSADEARQFVDWALQVRPGMSDAPNTAEMYISEFQRKYTVEEFEHRRAKMLSDYKYASHLWLEGRLHKRNATSTTTLGLAGIDPVWFEDFMKEMKSLDLVQRIRIGQVDQDWTIIDTYLFAKAKYDFAVFLEKVDPANCQRQITTVIGETQSANGQETDAALEKTQKGPSQAGLALFYFYCHAKSCLPPFQSGHLEQEYKKAVEPYGKSWKNFQQHYNRMGVKSERRAEGNMNALREAIEMLAGYPPALSMALDELAITETHQPLT